MTCEPRLAIVTFQGDGYWFARAALVRIQDGLVAGNDWITGDWFQVYETQCTVTFDPQEVTA
jgi:uncharacterized membrane protein